MFLLTFLACTAVETAPVITTPATDELHGRVDSTGPRDVLYMWGTRAEMAYAEGALYCDRVGPLFTDYLLDALVANHSQYDYEVTRAYVLAMTTYEDADHADIAAMYQGMVDACTAEQLTIVSDNLEPSANGSRMLEFEDMLFANAVADFGCSSFSVWGDASATGDTIHGRNFDWETDPEGQFLDNHILKVYSSSEEGGARWASLFVPGMVGCITCVTEEGVGLTMHNVGGLEAEFDADISPRMLAARAALVATWQAEDVVAAAEDALEPRRQLVGNNLHLSFPVARGGGIGAVVFEYDGGVSADGQVTVRHPGDDPGLAVAGAIVATNHYLLRSAPDTSGDSFDRLASLQTAVASGEAAGGLDATGAPTLLRAVERDHDGVTAHSVVIDAANRSIQVFVADDPDTPAPDSAPVTYDLDDLFAGLPD